MHPKRPILSLFSGAGGFDLGFIEAGFTPRLAIDADAGAVATYRRNHPHVAVEQQDIAQLSDANLLDLWSRISDEPPVGVIGGPPCQAFSVSNRRIKLNDERRTLPVHYARLLKALNAAHGLSFFVFENVGGLRTSLHLPDYQRFRELFEEAGFHLFEAALNAVHFGVAQQRTRLLLVGLNARQFLPDAFAFPEPPVLHQVRTVRTEIEGLPEPVYFQRGLIPAEFPEHPNHWTMLPKSSKFRDPDQRQNWSRGRSFRVLRWDAPSWTVAYGHREVHVHPSGHRRLSVYEAMLLQGFPKSYVLEGTLSTQFRLVGDAVPPPLAAAVARSIIQLLQAQPSKVMA